MHRILDNKGIQYFIIIGICLGLVLCVFTPEIGIFQRVAEFTVHIMLFYLMLALFFLATDQKRLMYVSFGACMILCLFLKQSSNANIRLPNKNEEVSLRIAHINVSSTNGNYEKLFDKLNELNVDVVSFQEVTPDWSKLIEYFLIDQFPYKNSLVRMDPFGMVLYSKLPMVKKDTFFYRHIPCIISEIKASPDKIVSIVTPYILPPLYTSAGLRTKEHFFLLSEAIRNTEGSKIVLGDFNMIYWASEMRSFMQDSKLSNSRRDIGNASLKPQYDHIFFSQDMECTSFEEIIDDELNHIGIVGSYQFTTTL